MDLDKLPIIFKKKYFRFFSFIKGPLFIFCSENTV